MDPLLNVLVHEATASFLEDKTIDSDTLPMDAEGKIDPADWENRRIAHEGVTVDRSMEGRGAIRAQLKIIPSNKIAELMSGRLAPGTLKPGLLVVADDEALKRLINVRMRWMDTEDGDSRILGDWLDEKYYQELARYEKNPYTSYVGGLYLEFFSYLRTKTNMSFSRVAIVGSNSPDMLICHEILHDAARTVREDSPQVFSHLANRMINLGNQDRLFYAAYDHLSFGKLYDPNDALDEFIARFFSPEMTRTTDKETKKHYRYILENTPDDIKKGLGELGFIWPTSATSSPVLKAPQKSSSSPGGIDLRSLPIVTQPMPGITSGIPQQDISVLQLDPQWQEIMKMLDAGIIPSSERLREYLLKCSDEDFNLEADRVIACIADILREEELRCCKTENALKNILVLLESGNNVQELRSGLTNIKVSQKEPALINRINYQP
ncbi:MAG: hypothetical protein FJZ12_02510 [Candidatus Omnitrophica bacterium]|nr:hypothetical protein [Candidatus Omnitrophota bacterium]